MSNYKRVLKHLNKEELSTQKVELALIDDLRQIVKEGSKLYTSYVNDMDDAKARLSIAIKSATKAVSVLKEADKFRDDVEAQAKELGVDLPGDVARINTKVSYQISEKDLTMMQSVFRQFKVR